MGRSIHKLKAVVLDRLAKKPGLHGDGGGLYLAVAPPSASSWVFRFMLSGRARTMGLGSYPEFSLAEAREKAADARKLKAHGQDPIEAKRSQQAATPSGMTFKQCADAYVKSHSAGWRGTKSYTQWTGTLKNYAEPVIGALPVRDIDVALVMKVLEPVWQSKPEMASRLRGRIENILDWARVNGYRDGENPARWRGHLDHLLPAPGKVKSVEHLSALPYAKVPDFMATLRTRTGVAPLALEFAILTAARTNEVLGARWDEIDLGAKMWTIAGERMKAGKEHRVPLSMPAIAILEAEAVKNSRGQGGLVFPGRRGEQRYDNTLLETLREIVASVTVHGFRSSFRDWASEETDFAGEVVEMALAHAIAGKAEAAYRRGDLFDKRRALMDEWAAFCGGQ